MLSGAFKVKTRIASIVLLLALVIQFIPETFVSQLFVDKAYGANYILWIKSVPIVGIYRDTSGNTNENSSSGYYYAKSNTGKTSPINKSGSLGTDLPLYQKAYYNIPLHVSKVGTWQTGMLNMPGQLFASAGLYLNKNSIELIPGSETGGLNVVNCVTPNQFVLSGTGDGNAFLEIGGSGRDAFADATLLTTRSSRQKIDSVGKGIYYYSDCNKLNYAYCKSLLGGSTERAIGIGSWFKIDSGVSISSSDSGSGGGSTPSEPDPPYYPPVTPPPDPVPRKPAVSTSVDRVEETVVNYKSNPTISISAKATDTTNYNSGDYGDRSSLSIALNSGLGNTSNSTTSSSVSTTSSSTLSFATLTKLNPVQFRYDFSGSGKVTLSSVGSATQPFSGNGYVTYQNNPPSTAVTIKTMGIGYGEPAAGFFYANTPTSLKVTFSDPENDIYRSTLYIAKKESWENNQVEFIYQAGGTNREFNRDDLFKLENITKSITGYSATITFLEPGNYVIVSIVEDINDSSIRSYIGSTTQSGDTLQSGIIKETNIEVRAEPEPPIAVISSPSYAFENQPYLATQQSTDPNNDIIEWKWTNPVDQDTTGSKPASSNLATAGKDGGSIVFPEGSAHHIYDISLTVKDATGFTDTAHKLIKVISNVPVANIQPDSDPDGPVDENNPDKNPPPNPDVPGGPSTDTSDPGGPNKDTSTSEVYYTDPNALKQNRRIILSAESSLGPAVDAIQWEKVVWTVTPITGTSTGIHQQIYDGAYKNSKIAMQFENVGTYEVKLQLTNNFSQQNPTHEDIEAATQVMIITVIEDKPPVTSIEITSGDHTLDGTCCEDEGLGSNEHAVKFKVTSSSVDGDLLPTSTRAYASKTYKWEIYEDITGSGNWVLIPESRRTYSDTFNEVMVKTSYPSGEFHNRYKAVVTTYETFAEPYNYSWLASDDSWRRSATTEITTSVNWKPEIEITPPRDDDQDVPENKKAVYEDTDIDGDGLTDGKFIRVYQNDQFKVGTVLIDEIPNKAKVTWTLYKKDHSGNMTSTSDSGKAWLSSTDVTSKLSNSGGTITISSPGIYMLKAVITDDMGLTEETTIMIRVYTLPIAVLEPNPSYTYYDLFDDDRAYTENTGWITKENIRWDVRSTNSIVDDEWGVAWHQIDFDKDWWEVSGVYTDSERKGQTIDPSEIHFMNADYATNSSALGYSKAIIEDNKYKSYTTLGTTDSIIYGAESSRLGWQSVASKAVDVVMVSGLNGLPNNDNLYQVGTSYRDLLFSTGDKLESELKSEDSSYNIKVTKTQTTYDTNDLFRNPDAYGYFDGFVNTKDEEANRYTVLHYTEYSDEGNRPGMSGTTYLAGDIGLMNEDEYGKQCKFGVIQILNGYEPSHPEAVDKPFVGTATVYARTGKVYSVEDFKAGGGWIEIASYSKRSTWDDLTVGELELLGEDNWRLNATNGNTLACSSKTDIQFKVEFTSDTSDGNAWTALVIRGWGGVYNDEYKMVTHTKSIREVLEDVTYRDNSLKIVVYNTNYSIGNQEFGSAENYDESKLQSLSEYLKAKGISRFVVIGPSSLATSVSKLKEFGVNAELLPFLGTYPESKVEAVSNADPNDKVVYFEYLNLSSNYGLDNYILSDTYENSIYAYVKNNVTVTTNSNYRSLSFTEPGLYTIRYKATNTYGKETSIVSYQILVTPDYAPQIIGSIADKWYRVWDAGKNQAVATIRIGGQTGTGTGDNLTVGSIDKDYISTSLATITWDADNSKTFTENDAKWTLDSELSNKAQNILATYNIGGTKYNAYIDYEFKKID